MMILQDLSNYRTMIRSLKRQFSDSPRKAGEIAYALLHCLIREKYPVLLPPEISDRRILEKDAIKKAHSWLLRLPPFEAAFWISSIYAELLDVKQREYHALYFTPPELAERLIKNLIQHGADFQRAVVCDPACGGSAFLMPAVMAISSALEKTGVSSRKILQHVESHLVGIDINHDLCKLSKKFIEIALYPHICRAGQFPKISISCTNILNKRSAFEQCCNIVLSNPPYRKISQSELRALTHSQKAILHYQGNIYSLFVDLVLSLVRDEGHIGLVTPASLLGGPSFGKLRARILGCAQAKQIDFIERREGVFLDVQQETVLTVFETKKTCPARQRIAICRSLPAGGFEKVGNATLSTSGEEAWFLPRNKEQRKLIQMGKQSALRLADYGYNVRIGYLVPYRTKLDCFTNKPRTRTVFPLIWSHHIGADGMFTFTRKKENREALFVDMESEDAPGIIRLPSVALHRVTNKEQEKRMIGAAITESFVRRHGGYVGENHVLFLVPEQENPSVDVILLADILNSRIMDQIFRCVSGVASLSKYELIRLPLPDPDRVRSSLKRGFDMDTAVCAGFSLSA